MSRLKLIILSMFTMFAVGALAASTASAADSCTTGHQPLFCTFPGNEPIHSESALGESGLSLLTGKVGLVEVKLHCTHGLFAGTLKLLGLATGEISFLNCKVEKPAEQGCEVGEGTNHLIPAFIHIQLNKETMGTVTGVATGTGTGSLEEFSKLTISGANCTVKGTFTVNGKQTVEFPNAEVGSATHQIVAKKSGSANLKFDEGAATFSSTATVHLASGKEWLVMLGT